MLGKATLRASKTAVREVIISTLCSSQRASSERAASIRCSALSPVTNLAFADDSTIRYRIGRSDNTKAKDTTRSETARSCISAWPNRAALQLCPGVFGQHQCPRPRRGQDAQLGVLSKT